MPPWGGAIARAGVRAVQYMHSMQVPAARVARVGSQCELKYSSSSDDNDAYTSPGRRRSAIHKIRVVGAHIPRAFRRRGRPCCAGKRTILGLPHGPGDWWWPR